VILPTPRACLGISFSFPPTQKGFYAIKVRCLGFQRHMENSPRGTVHTLRGSTVPRGGREPMWNVPRSISDCVGVET